jgi:hypothetical protein
MGRLDDIVTRNEVKNALGVPVSRGVSSDAPKTCAAEATFGDSR